MSFILNRSKTVKYLKYPDTLPVYPHVLHVVRVLFEPTDRSHRHSATAKISFLINTITGQEIRSVKTFCACQASGLTRLVKRK